MKYVAPEEILENENDLQIHWEGVASIPGTQRYHYFTSTGPYEIEAR